MYLYQGKLKNKELASVTSPRLPRCSIQNTSLSPHWQFWASLARTAWGHDQHTCHQPSPACVPNTAAPSPPKGSPRGARGRSPTPPRKTEQQRVRWTSGLEGWTLPVGTAHPSSSCLHKFIFHWQEPMHCEGVSAPRGHF